MYLALYYHTILLYWYRYLTLFVLSRRVCLCFYLLWEVPGWNLDRLNDCSVSSFSWFFSVIPRKHRDGVWGHDRILGSSSRFSHLPSTVLSTLCALIYWQRHKTNLRRDLSIIFVFPMVAFLEVHPHLHPVYLQWHITPYSITNTYWIDMVSVLRLLARTRMTDDYFLLPALMQQLGGPQNPLERFFFTVVGVRMSDVTKPCSGITPKRVFVWK